MEQDFSHGALRQHIIAPADKESQTEQIFTAKMGCWERCHLPPDDIYIWGDTVPVLLSMSEWLSAKPSGSVTWWALRRALHYLGPKSLLPPSVICKNSDDPLSSHPDPARCSHQFTSEHLLCGDTGWHTGDLTVHMTKAIPVLTEFLLGFFLYLL